MSLGKCGTALFLWPVWKILTRWIARMMLWMQLASPKEASRSHLESAFRQRIDGFLEPRRHPFGPSSPKPSLKLRGSNSKSHPRHGTVRKKPQPPKSSKLSTSPLRALFEACLLPSKFSELGGRRPARSEKNAGEVVENALWRCRKSSKQRCFGSSIAERSSTVQRKRLVCRTKESRTRSAPRRTSSDGKACSTEALIRRLLAIKSSQLGKAAEF
eukprot:CAMPEP_0206632252 /NCGR_PEP_ID=MMETSP0325_2-20121206/68785_1 /ASSEMBLY_ACC=CAM_ASM_000347 /TAXON_ID=2866 /ORGANISM="Crypthecodinium cohnii, Strain Seligo" /LENGTH=214 /DNA_ID=CAMNT_0054157721 /DNA_START=606 /DNA_END=1250 /DNA_ORIENTATION=-